MRDAGAALGAAVHGVAEIGFALRDGATRLSHLYQHDPLRVLFPRPVPGDLPTAAVVTTSGGLVAGDRIEMRVQLAAGAAAHVTASAADKIYRSTGPTTRVDQILRLDPGARLEFLPPETIVFDGARLRRKTVVELAQGVGFLGGGIIVFGRRARGESFTQGLLREVWEVRRDGHLAWGDALHIDGDVVAVMADPACFDNAAACATLLLAPPRHDPRALIDDARAVQARSAAPGLRGGTTIVGGLLVARWLGHDPLALRRAYADLACHLRAAALGLPPRLPPLWHV
ncbi:MAG TPA: urease accessory protein UreD [Stellaceae bacterium]|nr:urease accessory protein UreD [Stellaceae bacterium]